MAVTVAAEAWERFEHFLAGRGGINYAMFHGTGMHPYFTYRQSKCIVLLYVS